MTERSVMRQKIVRKIYETVVTIYHLNANSTHTDTGCLTSRCVAVIKEDTIYHIIVEGKMIPGNQTTRETPPEKRERDVRRDSQKIETQTHADYSC